MNAPQQRRKKKANKTYIFKNCRNASSSSSMSSTCPDFRADAVYAACPSPPPHAHQLVLRYEELPMPSFSSATV